MQEFEEVSRARKGPAAKRREAEELKHSAVSRIAEGVYKGPLLLLKRCYNDGARIRIVTRHARGVRGAATGAPLVTKPSSRSFVHGSLKSCLILKASMMQYSWAMTDADCQATNAQDHLFLSYTVPVT